MATATPIESKADFDAALAASSTKFVTIYVYEGAISEDVRERFQSIAPLLADKVESYKLNLETDPAEAKEKLKLESVPALIVYKGGEEVERVYKPGEAEMKEVVGRLLG